MLDVIMKGILTYAKTYIRDNHLPTGSLLIVVEEQCIYFRGKKYRINLEEVE